MIFYTFRINYVKLLFERGPRVVIILSKELSSICAAVASQLYLILLTSVS